MSTPIVNLESVQNTLDRALEDRPEEGIVRVNRNIFTDP